MKNTDKKNNFYYTIHSFMTHELGLKGSALIVYAIIYEFSGNGNGTFYGTLDFISEYSGICKNSVLQAVRQLSGKGLIFAEKSTVRNGRCYRINTEALKTKEPQDNITLSAPQYHRFFTL